MLSGVMHNIGKLKFLLNENSSTILTAVGVAGTVSTSVLTAKSSFSAARVLEQEKLEIVKNQRAAMLQAVHEGTFDTTKEADAQMWMSLEDPVNLSSFERVKLVWTLYIPPVAMGAITITSIILAHKIDAKRIAALTAALGVTERSYQEYKDKIHEKLGDRETGKIRDELNQDRVKKNPPSTSETIMIGAGDVLCMDSYTGRYFHSNMETIRSAENALNFQLLNHDDCSLSDFLDDLGVSATIATDEVGWNISHGSVRVEVTAAKTEDERPCLVLEYSPNPTQRYSKFHES